MDFIPYKSNETLENKFYQIPQELFVNSLYKDKLNSDSKIIYSLLLDRLSLSQNLHKILDENENLQLIIETNKEFELNKEECKMLQKLYQIFMRIYDYEEREIFFLGARENYFYFKNMNLIKE